MAKGGVNWDFVADKQHHGGLDMACYLYSYKHYAFWKNKYPALNFEYGIFGENITVDELDEEDVRIGDVFQVGEAQVQVSQPRQPCYKLGLRFKDPAMVNEFKLAPYPGVYVRVLEEGHVKSGDEMKRIHRYAGAPELVEIYRIIYQPVIRRELAETLLANEHLAENVKRKIRLKQLV